MLPVNTVHIDKPLLLRISLGDEQAFKILFDHYKDRFYAVALKMTGREDVAEETVQEVFIKIWRQQATLAEVDNPDAYFFTVVYRQVYQYYKKLALEKKLLEQELEKPAASQNYADEVVLAKESERFLHEAISKLPPQQQLIFKLNKNDGFSRSQIAEQLNLSPNTVRNHLAEAVKTVRLYLKDLALLLSIFFADLLR